MRQANRLCGRFCIRQRIELGYRGVPVLSYAARDWPVGSRPDNELQRATRVDEFLHECQGLCSPFINELRLVNLTRLINFMGSLPFGLRLAYIRYT